MTKNSAQQAYALLTLYQKLYKDKYRKTAHVNKYREKWAMVDVIDSVGYDRARKLLEYYFKTGKVGHPLMFFYNNFDRMDDMLAQRELDDIKRAELKEQTRIMVAEREAQVEHRERTDFGNMSE